MITLCDADGTLDMTPEAMSRRTGIPLEHIKTGLEILLAPDSNSRTPDENGRRIVLIDEHRNWGWVIVNHKKYRELQDSDTIRAQTRERVRRYREKRKQEALCNVTVTDGNAQKRHTDTDTYTNTKDIYPPTSDISLHQKGERPVSVPYEKIKTLYHEILPTLPKVEKLTAKRKSWIKQRWCEDMNKLDNWKNYFDYVAQSDFLMGRTTSSNGRPPFRATLEWLTNAGNFAKVSEGNYHV
jgi:PHD/YefM family antitoxin component YafN of YafNO toxin-antitoxin module